jgi:hypothetical protein
MKTFIIVESTDNGSDKALVKSILENMGFDLNNFYIKSTANANKRTTGNVKDVIKYIKTQICRETSDLYKWEEIKNILIIVDADENIEDRFKEIIEALNNNESKNNFNIPSQIGIINKDDANKINIGIYLMPDCMSAGSLETLCLQALVPKEKGKLEDCVEKYFYCLGQNGYLKTTGGQDMTENNKSKSKFRVCMATPNPDAYISSIKENIDFKSGAFDKLVKFLKGAE